MMDEILSEKELMPSGLSWGDWNFSSTDKQIDEKFASLPKILEGSHESSDNIWRNLFSLLPDEPKENPVKPITNHDSVVCLDESILESPKDCLPIDESETNFQKEAEESNSSIDDLVLCLVDMCNQSAPKLKSGLDYIRDEMASFLMNDIESLNENFVILVMEKAWSQLNSEMARVVFCIGFSSKHTFCKTLCQKILLTWMSKSLPTKLEQFSDMFSLESEIFCRFLIAPLLLIENSPLVKDLFSLEEIMNSMSKRHWTLLLTEVLMSLEDLQDWNIPILAMIIEHSEPSFDNVSDVVQLMTSSESGFAHSRDFGSLLVAVVQCLKPGFASIMPQLKLVANSYKGSLKFKALKIMGDFKEL